jgi:hypothetical protein
MGVGREGLWRSNPNTYVLAGRSLARYICMDLVFEGREAELYSGN